jgi:myotubularin-related protein 1/2
MYCVYSCTREGDRPAKFYVFDARGKLAVMANKTIGKGTEIAGEYRNTEVLFCNIDNMHVIRNSYEGFANAMFAPSDSNDDSFHKEIADSGWLAHCGKVIKSAVDLAEKIHFERCSVLVHCSDGWDRTPQIVGTAQLLLDPYYRTLEGFFVLVEKEWCAFGHKFKDRWEHSEAVDANQRSPIFTQWLHIVHMVMEQSGDSFEYNEYMLVFMADHVSSALFGNFLENTECLRKKQLDVMNKTQSIWSYILNKRQQFTNLHYRPYGSPIWPSSDSRHLSSWKRFFLRWDVNAHPIGAMSEEWFDDW